MDEHGAAAPGHAWPGVVIEFDNQIVKAVVTAEPVAWFIGRPAECVVIAAVCWVFAPGVVKSDPARREQSPWPRQAIGAPPQANRVKPAGWRGGIAFAFGCLNPGAAERDARRPECPGATDQPALATPARPGVDTNETKRNSSHPGPLDSLNSQPASALVSSAFVLRARRRGKAAAGLGIYAEYAEDSYRR